MSDLSVGALASLVIGLFLGACVLIFGTDCDNGPPGFADAAAGECKTVALSKYWDHCPHAKHKMVTEGRGFCVCEE